MLAPDVVPDIFAVLNVVIEEDEVLLATLVEIFTGLMEIAPDVVPGVLVGFTTVELVIEEEEDEVLLATLVETFTLPMVVDPTELVPGVVPDTGFGVEVALKLFRVLKIDDDCCGFKVVVDPTKNEAGVGVDILSNFNNSVMLGREFNCFRMVSTDVALLPPLKTASTIFRTVEITPVSIIFDVNPWTLETLKLMIFVRSFVTFETNSAPWFRMEEKRDPIPVSFSGLTPFTVVVESMEALFGLIVAVKNMGALDLRVVVENAEALFGFELLLVITVDLSTF